MQAARLGLALAGFVFAGAAVVLDDHRLGWAAIGLLAGSLVLRLVSRRRSDPDR